MLEARNIQISFGEKRIVDGISFSLQEGQWLMLAGPNGAGKSTLIEAIAQGVSYQGQFLFEGKDVRQWKSTTLAQRIGILSQKNAVAYAYTVDEVVSLGRYAHRGNILSGGDAGGAEMVEKALEMTGMKSLRHQNMLTLSGGEMQRAFLAQVFAQDPRILILDEPANHLDLRYQQEIFSLIQEWLRVPGRAVLSVVHDLSLARKYGTHAILMHEGKCVSSGRIRDVMTREHLQQVYDMDVYAWMQDMLSQWT
ncbi:MAG: ABC transporter ATP-binding protein [Clostridia bacterium]|nr:ABC transporter ATP-binding protein [Clostridia bacterium]